MFIRKVINYNLIQYFVLKFVKKNRIEEFLKK